ncbi:MAG: BamA/TamA family outer membrane protein [Kofleriaceae bacterium]|nr:BamA/TamA family outer membrane protein [Kofleriaceae bacterium]
MSTDFTLPQAVAFGAKGPDIGFSNESGIVGALRSGVTYDNELPSNRRIAADLFTEISSPWLGSDYSMVRAGAKASYRRPLIGPFGLHLQGGLEGVMSKQGMLVPRAERLYFEGHSDVRGFQLGSAGMEQGSGFKATGRAELEFEIVPRWGVSGALFYDAGIFGTGESAKLAHSVGGSLIMDSLLGPVRLDLALPLDGSDSPMVLLGIGGSF